MTFAVASYGAAAVGFAVLAVLLVFRREAGRRGRHYLVLAVAGTAMWAAALVVLLLAPADPRFLLVPDALRALLWTLCILAALPGPASWRSSKGLMTASAVVLAVLSVAASLDFLSPPVQYQALLGATILGCLAVEQVIRNSTPAQLSTLRFFHWSLAAVLAYDLFVFSEAALFDGVDTALWVPRGLITAASVPVFLLAAKRHPDWTETLFISREFVFYTATLTAVGAYLLAMALGGLVILERGGGWGPSIQLGYLAAALGLLAIVLSSGRWKGKLRVFISKHFYRNRYDYRDEWLRLIRTLSGSENELPLDQRSIKALCDIVGSNGGCLWFDRDARGVFEPFGSWQAAFPTREYSAQSPLVQFLTQFEWVIDARQYERDPEHYQNAFRDTPADLPSNSLVVPLLHERTLLGFVALNRPSNLPDLNYEDHDLLKTAGRQVASFLANDLARERLGVARQFDAFHQLSAFVMHDLKNVLAQQSLLLDNAKRFRDKPEFVEDALRTIDSGVQRISRLLRQLQQGALVSKEQRVELNRLLLRAVSACADNGRTPCTFANHGAALWVQGNAEQLTNVIVHVIQNAQDASPNDRAVAVRLDAVGEQALIEVRDEGRGMSEEFVRRRLFKPFETTKGTAGMGIGAYQARAVVRGLGGELTVTSEVGCGTVLKILLPRVP